MTKKGTTSATTLSLALLLFCQLTGVAQTTTTQSRLSIGEARSRLEELQAQLMRVERESQEELERTVAEQLNEGPKGEFETTKEYEARRAKASKQREQIEENLKRKKEARREEINRRINGILTVEFVQPFEARLGTYDADAQRFPLLVPPGSHETLFVPRLEAKELKENFARTEKTGTFALQLDAQNRAQVYLLSGAISYAGKVYRIERSEMNGARAMFMLYGNYNPANKRAKWIGVPNWWSEGDAEGQAFEAIPQFSRSFSEGGANKFVLVTASLAEGEAEFGDCHPCGVKMGAAVFVQRGETWRLEVGQKDVGTYGAFGIPPNVGLEKIGPERHAVTFSWGDMHQGVTDEGTAYVDRADGAFREILWLDTGHSTEGAGTFSIAEDNLIYNSKIEYLPGNNPAYFDLKVTLSGKRGARVGRRVVMRPFTKVEVYKFSDGVYIASVPR